MMSLASRARRLMSHGRESLRRPFLESQQSAGNLHGFEQKAEHVFSIGDTARYMANRNLQDENEWTALIQDALQNISSLTPSDIALTLSSLKRTGRVHGPLYTSLAKRICHMISFFSSAHLAMIISAYAKAGLMEDNLYRKLKDEIRNRLYEFSTPVELCMVLNALARCKETEQELLGKLANTIKYHIESFITQEIALVANRYHALDFYDHELFEAMKGRIKKHIGRYYPEEAIDVLAAYEHFGKDDEELKSMIMSHMKEQHAYLRGPTFVKLVEESRLRPETKKELLAFEESP